MFCYYIESALMQDAVQLWHLRIVDEFEYVVNNLVLIWIRRTHTYDKHH